MAITHFHATTQLINTHFIFGHTCPWITACVCVCRRGKRWWRRAEWEMRATRGRWGCIYRRRRKSVKREDETYTCSKMRRRERGQDDRHRGRERRWRRGVSRPSPPCPPCPACLLPLPLSRRQPLSVPVPALPALPSHCPSSSLIWRGEVDGSMRWRREPCHAMHAHGAGVWQAGVHGVGKGEGKRCRQDRERWWRGR